MRSGLWLYTPPPLPLPEDPPLLLASSHTSLSASPSPDPISISLTPVLASCWPSRPLTSASASLPPPLPLPLALSPSLYLSLSLSFSFSLSLSFSFSLSFSLSLSPTFRISLHVSPFPLAGGLAMRSPRYDGEQSSLRCAYEQASSDSSICLVVEEDAADRAERALSSAFERELQRSQIGERRHLTLEQRMSLSLEACVRSYVCHTRLHLTQHLLASYTC